MTTTANNEARQLQLSGSSEGSHILVNGNAWNNLTEVHHMSDVDAIDTVYLWAHNPSSDRKYLKLVINPGNFTSQSTVDNSTEIYAIPPYSSIPILEGHKLEVRSGQGAIRAYTDTAGDVSVRGHVVRTTQVEVTA